MRHIHFRILLPQSREGRACVYFFTFTQIDPILILTLCRLAQAVLAREDPQESFLKAVPTDNGELQIIYPSIVSERLVRRRLRVLMHQGRRRHRVRLMLWSLLFLPQIPLMVTPLPNITVYYTVYRIWSHASALQGSRTLDKCFAALDTQQLATLRDDLLRLQASTGIVYPPDSWPARLIKKESRYLDIFNSLRRLQQQRRLEAQLQRQQSAVPTAAALLDPHALPSSQMHPPPVAASAPKYNHGDKGEHHGSDSSQEETAHVCTSSTGLHLIFSKSSELCDLVRPIDRERTPLGDEAALAIGKYFKAPHLLENVARARRRAIGSMFPAHSHEW